MQKQQQKPIGNAKKHKVFGPVATVFSSENTGSWRLERPRVNYTECIKCGNCEKFCPVNCIDIYKDQEECVVINFEYCKGCGICANECPKDCIEMVPERSEL